MRRFLTGFVLGWGLEFSGLAVALFFFIVYQLRAPQFCPGPHPLSDWEQTGCSVGVVMGIGLLLTGAVVLAITYWGRPPYLLNRPPYRLLRYQLPWDDPRLQFDVADSAQFHVPGGCVHCGSRRGEKRTINFGLRIARVERLGFLWWWFGLLGGLVAELAGRFRRMPKVEGRKVCGAELHYRVCAHCRPKQSWANWMLAFGFVWLLGSLLVTPLGLVAVALWNLPSVIGIAFGLARQVADEVVGDRVSIFADYRTVSLTVPEDRRLNVGNLPDIAGATHHGDKEDSIDPLRPVATQAGQLPIPSLERTQDARPAGNVCVRRERSTAQTHTEPVSGKTSRLALFSLVLGLLVLAIFATCGLTVCLHILGHATWGSDRQTLTAAVGFVAALVAICCAHTALFRIRRSSGRLVGRDPAEWGLVIGYVYVGLSPLIFGSCFYLSPKEGKAAREAATDRIAKLRESPPGAGHSTEVKTPRTLDDQRTGAAHPAVEAAVKEASVGNPWGVAEAAIDCSDVRDYSIRTAVQIRMSVSGTSPPGRYNFGEKLGVKDAVTFGNGVKLDLAYQSTFMRVNGKEGVFHYGLRADPSEISQARVFAICYERQKPSLRNDRITLRSKPEPNIILLRETSDGFVPVAHYEVEE